MFGSKLCCRIFFHLSNAYREKRTALHYASMYAENTDNVTALLDAGADVEATDLYDTPTQCKCIFKNVSSFTHRLRRTPLHYCAFHNNVHAVQALLNARADINAKST